YAAIMPIATALTTAFGAAILATPIGWIILGIAALVAVVVLIIKYWDEFVAIFKKGAALVWKFAKILFPPFRLLEEGLKRLMDMGGKVFSFFSKLAAPFKSVFDGVQDIETRVTTANEGSEDGAGGASAASSPQVVTPTDRVSK